MFKSGPPVGPSGAGSFHTFELLIQVDLMALKGNSQTSPKLGNLNIEYGKLPPQAVDLEEAVLGAIMLEKDAVLSVLDILKPESFYRDAHQRIYKAIIDLSMEV